jgi:hypothetical protein
MYVCMYVCVHDVDSIVVGEILPCSQQLAPVFGPVPDESSPHPYILLMYDTV